MQIPHTPLAFVQWILQPPQPGGRQQADPRPAAQAGARQAGDRAPSDVTVQALARAAAKGALGEAVESLAAEGRLPRRGSLIDRRA